MAEAELEDEHLEVEPPERKLMERLGALLRQRRIALGMNQNDMALATGVGRRFIIDLEAGKPSCQVGKALLVAEALGLRVVDLVEGQVTHRQDQLDDGHFEPTPVAAPSKVQDATGDADLPDDLEEPSP